MIELSDVSFSYRGVDRACGGVRRVNLSVEAGKCVLVCGRSGCGKTTVTRLANGLAPSFFPGELSGRVCVDGRDVSELDSWEVSEAVGSVFQNPRTQFFNVDSTSEVAFALESRGWPEEDIRKRTRETIAELGLEGLADRSIFDLSGGEKQRIAYASVWAPHPTNLVLDEPTGNLDLNAIADLRRYLLAAKAEGTAILIAEHRLWWLADVMDEVVVLQEGRVVRRMDSREFNELPPEELRKMGLRTRDLATVRARQSRGADARPRFVPGEPFLDIEELRVSYGEKSVLDGVGMRVPKGGIAAIVGRNGAGKSTLCRTAVGLMKERSGTIEFDGHGPVTARNRLKSSAMVFQDVNYQLFAHSVKAEVTFGLKGAERPTADEVRALLRRLDLDAVADRHPATLSGGQKQRLAVAANIASNKKLLVFDEPTSGFDLDSMLAVASLLSDLANEGRTVLVSTHDLEFIACACDRVFLVKGGRMEKEASVEADLASVRGMLASSG